MSIKTNVNQMQIGDKIIAEYYATNSGYIGQFRNLGTSTASLIPSASSATPNGAFYLVMVDTDYFGRKILVADRNIQISIPWDTLNTNGIPFGKKLGFTAIPVMTANNAPSGNVISSNNSTTAWNAFNGGFAGTWSGGSAPCWIGYQFPTPKIITAYRFYDAGAAGLAPTAWSFQGSNDGTNWSTLDTRSGVNDWVSAIAQDFYFSNTTAYTYYRINITAGYQLSGIQMFETSQTVRMLSGGVSSSDTNDEWDKYIVNSTLNGTITAGDNNVWNWSGVYSWTNSSSSLSDTSKVERGNTNANTWTYASTSGGGGFRPVFIFDTPVYTYLFQDGNNILTYSNSAWTNIGTTPVTDTMFQNNGVTDLFSIDNTAISQLSSPQLLVWEQKPQITTPNLSITGTPIINYKYKVTSDNPNYQTIQDYGSNYTNVNTNTFVTIPPVFFTSDNPYTITVTALQDDGVTSASASGTVQLIDTQPTISASVTTGNTLNVTVGDNESDQIQYLIKLNGNQVYPALTGMTGLMPSPTTYIRTFKSNEILIGQTNTIEIDAIDQYGMSGSATLTFTGNYTGILFSDMQGNYYSDDLGNVLKYLDFGSIIAGQTSDVMMVNVKNMNSFAINNLNIWLETAEPSGVMIEFSPSNNPFIGSNSLTISDSIASGDSISFYIRISTTNQAKTGGTFDVYAKANPS